MPARRKSPRLRGRPPSSSAEHRRVAAALKAQIDAGAWKAFEILPPVRALARAHRASVCAVRLALERLVDEGLVARNARRRRMFLSSTQGYAMDGRGIVLEVHSDPLDVRESGSVFMEVQRGILAGCGDGLAPLLIAHAHELQAAQPDGFLDLPLKGILLYGRFTRKNLQAYERLTVPVCNVDSPPEGLRLHSVSVENQSAAYDATRRLMALGHRRIAFVQFILYTLRDIDPDSKERRDGYLRACKEAGITNAINTIFSFLPGRDVQHSLRALLKARPRFTAALCVDPTGADALTQEAERAGLKLPRDLGIVCFQGAAEKVRFSGPATDFFTLGRRAARLLDRPRLPPIYERVATSWREQGSVVPAH